MGSESVASGTAEVPVARGMREEGEEKGVPLKHWNRRAGRQGTTEWRSSEAGGKSFSWARARPTPQPERELMVTPSSGSKSTGAQRPVWQPMRRPETTIPTTQAAAIIPNPARRIGKMPTTVPPEFRKHCQSADRDYHRSTVRMMEHFGLLEEKNILVLGCGMSSANFDYLTSNHAHVTFSDKCPRVVANFASKIPEGHKAAIEVVQADMFDLKPEMFAVKYDTVVVMKCVGHALAANLTSMGMVDYTPETLEGQMAKLHSGLDKVCNKYYHVVYDYAKPTKNMANGDRMTVDKFETKDEYLTQTFYGNYEDVNVEAAFPDPRYNICLEWEPMEKMRTHGISPQRWVQQVIERVRDAVRSEMGRFGGKRESQPLQDFCVPAISMETVKEGLKIGEEKTIETAAPFKSKSASNQDRTTNLCVYGLKTFPTRNAHQYAETGELYPKFNGTQCEFAISGPALVLKRGANVVVLQKGKDEKTKACGTLELVEATKGMVGVVTHLSHYCGKTSDLNSNMLTKFDVKVAKTLSKYGLLMQHEDYIYSVTGNSATVSVGGTNVSLPVDGVHVRPAVGKSTFIKPLGEMSIDISREQAMDERSGYMKTIRNMSGTEFKIVDERKVVTDVELEYMVYEDPRIMRELRIEPLSWGDEADVIDKAKAAIANQMKGEGALIGGVSEICECSISDNVDIWKVKRDRPDRDHPNSLSICASTVAAAKLAKLRSWPQTVENLIKKISRRQQ